LSFWIAESAWGAFLEHSGLSFPILTARLEERTRIKVLFIRQWNAQVAHKPLTRRRRRNTRSYKQPRIVTFLGYVALMVGFTSLLWTIAHYALHLM
jgi:hypothetical protein